MSSIQVWLWKEGIWVNLERTEKRRFSQPHWEEKQIKRPSDSGVQAQEPDMRFSDSSG